MSEIENTFESELKTYTRSVYVTIDLIVKAVTCDNLMIAHRKFMHFVYDSSASQINSLAFNMDIYFINPDTEAVQSNSIVLLWHATSFCYVRKIREPWTFLTVYRTDSDKWDSGHWYIACFWIWNSSIFPRSSSLILWLSILLRSPSLFHFRVRIEQPCDWKWRTYFKNSAAKELKQKWFVVAIPQWEFLLLMHTWSGLSVFTVARTAIHIFHPYIRQTKNDDDNLSNTFTINQAKETVLMVDWNVESFSKSFSPNRCTSLFRMLSFEMW